ncbi:MAG: hypothetical protein M3186_07550 [Actinomycetota bacterium]|nr:hypothetical protein [Actinomycetota bacterium]
MVLAGSTQAGLYRIAGPPPAPGFPVLSEARRRLSFHDRDGGYELAGWLDREAAEIIRSALSPLAAPRPTTDTEGLPAKPGATRRRRPGRTRPARPGQR